MKTASFFVRVALLSVVLLALAVLGCGGRKPAHKPAGGGGTASGTNASAADAESSSPAQPDIVYPGQWQEKAMHMPIHGKTLSEVMFNLDKETAADKLNFVIYNVGQYSTEGLPAGATLKDLMDVASSRWHLYFYSDIDVLAIAMTVDYGRVQHHTNRVHDAFDTVQDREHWQKPCGKLVVANGSPAKLLDYVRKLDPKGKYKVEGKPPQLRMDLLLTGIPIECAVTYLAWSAGADLGFSSDGTLYFTFPR